MFNKKKLKNGLRLILAPLKGTKAVTVLVLFKVGSRYENKSNNGISHFIEHMMFKGTKRRPDTLTISKDLDRVGAEYNAFTSRDYTGYYVKVDAEKIDLALDILSDMIFNSKFETSEINREKGVISEEIKMYEDNPMMFVDDLFEENLFGEDHPLGRKISGSIKGINKFSRKEMLSYKEKYYRPDNGVIVLAGNTSHLDDKSINKYFGKAKGKTEASFKSFSYKDDKPKIKIQFRETEQVQLALGFPAYSYFNDNIYALNLLSIILGGNMSSRLFISIREKKGLCYFIRTFTNTYEDTGSLIVQSGLDKNRVETAVQAIIEELNKVKKKGVTAEELNRAKECIKGKLVLTLEDSSNVADWYAKQELLIGKALTPEAKFKKIFKVTQRDIQSVANEIIQKERLNIALIGPVEEKKFVEKIK